MYDQLFVDSVVAINIVASLYIALLLGLYLYRRKLAWTMKQNGFLLLAFFFPAMLVISLSHASWIQGSSIESLLYWLEIFFIVTAGPLILAAVWGHAVTYLQLALAISLSAFCVLVLAIADLGSFIPFVPAIFTLGSAAFLLKHGLFAGTRLQQHLLAVALLIHLAQLIRYLGRDISWLNEIVPLTATLIGLAYLGWFLQGRHRAGATLGRPEISPGIFSSLDAYVRKTEAFRNPDLSLSGLADEMQLAPYLLSQAVNQHAGRFTDYINTYRVSTFLKEYAPQSKVEVLAYQAGFRSRSAFYRAFKTFTGKTPSQYYLADKKNSIYCAE